MSYGRQANYFMSVSEPYGICDECLTEAINLPNVEMAEILSDTLASTSDFKKEQDQCCRCQCYVVATRPTVKHGQPEVRFGATSPTMYEPLKIELEVTGEVLVHIDLKNGK